MEHQTILKNRVIRSCIISKLIRKENFLINLIKNNFIILKLYEWKLSKEFPSALKSWQN